MMGFKSKKKKQNGLHATGTTRDGIVDMITTYGKYLSSFMITKS